MDSIIQGLLAGLLFVGLGYVYNRVNTKMKLSILKSRIKRENVNKLDLIQIIQFYTNSKKIRSQGFEFVKVAEDKFPDDKEVNLVILSFYLKELDLVKAMEKINTLYTSYPNDADIVFAKGLLHLRNGEIDIANDYRKKAISIDKSYEAKEFNTDI